MHKIGILAYGSLINDPGAEIKPLIIKKLECKTMFNVEYARKSRTRGNGPTLIPCETIGRKVNAVILILDSKTDLNDAKSMLWRRETGNINSNKSYTHSNSPKTNKVQVETLNEIENIETILYTSIGKNIEGDITPENLADLAISSILSDAGEKKKDGVRYLLSNKQNGIITELSEQYEKNILSKTKCRSLEDVIEKMDKERKTKACI